jgi:hypothetical protein
MGKRIWQEFFRCYRRVEQRLSLIRAARRIAKGKPWISLALRMLAEYHCAFFRSILDCALPLALAHVNALLLDAGCPAISKLDELSVYRDVPHREIPKFVDGDKVVSGVVNQLLAGKPIPEPCEVGNGQVTEIEEDDLTEITAHIDLMGTLFSFTQRQIAQLAEITTIGVTLFITNNFVDAVFTAYFHRIRYPLERNIPSDRVVDTLVERMPFDELDEFADVGPDHLLRFTPVDEERYANDPMARDLAREYLDSQQLPVTSNLVPSGDIDEIIDYVSELLILQSWDPKTQMSSIERFELRDSLLVVNNWTVDLFLLESFQQLNPPIEYNTVASETVREIATADAHSITSVCIPIVTVRAIREYSRRSIVDIGKFVDDLVLGYLTDTTARLALASNTIDSDAVGDTAADDIVDAFFIIDFVHCRILKEFSGIDTGYYTHFATENLMSELSQEDEIPVLRNTATSRDIAAVADFEFDSIEPFAVVNLDSLNVQPRAICCTVKANDIMDLRESLLAELWLPLCPNTASSRILGAIVESSSLDFAIPMVTTTIRSLESFAIDDGQASLRDGPIDRISEDLFAESEGAIPLCPNIVTNQVIRDICEVPSVFAPCVTIDIGVLDCVHPSERRINSEFPLTLATLLPIELSRLPIADNQCSTRISLQILTVIEPVTFFGFALNTCAPLIAGFEAPAEVIEEIEEVANRLLALVLKQDVIPVLPISGEPTEDILEDIIAPLSADREILAGVSDLAVDILAQIKPIQMPPFTTAEEVIMALLEDCVLPAIPVVKLRRDIGDVVDDLLSVDLPPAIARKDFTDPIVMSIVSKYRRRSLIRKDADDSL